MHGREDRGALDAAGVASCSFVSLMSSSGVPVEEIARLAGHSSSRTTEVVYRRELRPVLTTGAEAMDRLFSGRAWVPSHAAMDDSFDDRLPVHYQDISPSR
jgi:hypothetical protein